MTTHETAFDAATRPARILAMALAVLALCAPALAAAEMAEEAPVPTARIELPTLNITAFEPYTMEVPAHWIARRDLPAPGVFVGPQAGTPQNHPEMILVHPSEVDLSNPQQVLDTLKANAAKASWSLSEARVQDFGGVQGLWIVRRLPPEGLHGERVNLAVKLPLEKGSLDVTVTLPVDQLDELRPAVEKILLSLRPVEKGGTEKGS